MPGPLLELLSLSARTAFPYVTELVEKGFSVDAIQGILQGKGLGFRRTDLTTMVRELRGNVDRRPYLSSLRRDVLPNPARLGTPLTNTLRRFSFNVEVRGVNTETTEPQTLMVRVSSSENLTKATIEDIALSLAESAGGEGRYANFQPQRAIVTEGTFNPNR